MVFVNLFVLLFSFKCLLLYIYIYLKSKPLKTTYFLEEEVIFQCSGSVFLLSYTAFLVTSLKRFNSLHWDFTEDLRKSKKSQRSFQFMWSWNHLIKRKMTLIFSNFSKACFARDANLRTNCRPQPKAVETTVDLESSSCNLITWEGATALTRLGEGRNRWVETPDVTANPVTERNWWIMGAFASGFQGGTLHKINVLWGSFHSKRRSLEKSLGWKQKAN